MKLLSFILFVLFVLTFSACGQIPMAEQIKVGDLPRILGKVQNHKAEFNFAGITSNGIDCIYFMPGEDGKFDIDFEAMIKAQVPFIEKLKKYAADHQIKSEMTSYGNKMNDTGQPAQVLHLETNLSVDEVSRLGEQIEHEIFGNNADTRYEVVP